MWRPHTVVVSVGIATMNGNVFLLIEDLRSALVRAIDVRFVGVVPLAIIGIIAHCGCVFPRTGGAKIRTVG